VNRPYFATPLAGTGWVHGAVLFITGSTVTTWKNGTIVANALSGGAGQLDSPTLSSYIGRSTIYQAEVGLWARSDGSLDQTVAAAIVAKLSDAANAQRRAIDITDLAASFYAPLLPGGDANDLVAGVTGTPDAHSIADSDHPWAIEMPPPLFRSIRVSGVG
jgi:hypothetical protein